MVVVDVSVIAAIVVVLVMSPICDVVVAVFFLLFPTDNPIYTIKATRLVIPRTINRDDKVQTTVEVFWDIFKMIIPIRNVIFLKTTISIGKSNSTALDCRNMYIQLNDYNQGLQSIQIVFKCYNILLLRCSLIIRKKYFLILLY